MVGCCNGKRTGGASSGSRKKAKTTKVSKPMTYCKPELKEYIGNSNGNVPANALKSLIIAGSIVQGTGPNQRIGNKIRIKSIDVIGTYTSNAGFTTPLYAIFGSLKDIAAAGSPEGPFYTTDVATLWDWDQYDPLAKNTYCFRKTFAGAGYEVRYDPITQLPQGDHDPRVVINNLAGVLVNGNNIYLRVRYYDC